jgi:hypothetical protein
MSHQSYGVPASGIASGAQGANRAPMELPTHVQRVNDQALWSTSQLGRLNDPTADTTLRFFTAPIGQNGQGYTRSLHFADTNIKQNSMIPVGAAATVLGISLSPYYVIPRGSTGLGGLNGPLHVPVPLTDLLSMQNQSALQWDLFGTRIDVCPFLNAPAGGGAFGSTADTGAAFGPPNVGSQVALNNGAGGFWSYNFLPIMLPAGQTFSLDLLFGPDAQRIGVGLPATSGQDPVVNEFAEMAARIRCVLYVAFDQAVAIG